MQAYLYIDQDLIGEIKLSVIDESMGVVGGFLLCYPAYAKYRKEVQKHTKRKGISNSTDYNYKILLSDSFQIKPEGGIGITDIEKMDEIYVEAAGLEIEILSKIKAT